MKKRWEHAAACAALSALALLAGCKPQPQPQPPAPQAAIANPASEYCVKQGGRLETVNEADGAKGVCHLPDGTAIEEWTLYRRDHPA
ncbi:putative hemolysin [Pseudoxanthomonas winnipegensis]|uniref:DUF333 domain-containing protein n=1 Tax=Pseudoxanthomonas winnipegensis TaxID=2480810 RepID=A0A4Q8L990_9GAMM|nr:DUF333 domain-containing protein [Pseudoxanthomonas winnipegensis]RZZ82762.1 DUF333 domain-containing protein [Pseudoxanthomonas winnipegensis]TAA24947.1 DUF333 domain-containing protein [Pseudoxanthomonas winnipegensis]TAA39379.1 DUF333 domain-containing protein [Pseudoxanthomonas winnipegensis]TBV75235.1 DUF333 domain-containing protein [Pseudoxanthomonas winnipegensis]